MSRAFLSEVVGHVRAAVAGPEYARGVPPERGVPPPSLKAAIDRDRGRGALVVEYKRASPGSSEPLPRPRSVAEFVDATAAADVAGYSCLATAHGFDGSPALVVDLVGRTRRPVLFKEFVLGRRQLEVAARSGAAAVLLIARLADTGALEAPLPTLAEEAHALGLEVVLELHDPAELSRTDRVRADVVGVNSRDLDTLRFERERAFATIERAVEAGRRPLLGLSGVAGPADALAFWRRGCDGVLVGSAVARAERPAAWLETLRRPAGS